MLGMYPLKSIMVICVVTIYVKYERVTIRVGVIAIIIIFTDFE